MSCEEILCQRVIRSYASVWYDPMQRGFRLADGRSPCTRDVCVDLKALLKLVQFKAIPGCGSHFPYIPKICMLQQEALLLLLTGCMLRDTKAS